MLDLLVLVRLMIKSVGGRFKFYLRVYPLERNNLNWSASEEEAEKPKDEKFKYLSAE